MITTEQPTMSDEGVTNGELYRLILAMKQETHASLASMKQETGAALAGIYAEQKLTNGRVRRSELAIVVLQVGYAIAAAIGGALFYWALNAWGPGK